MLAEGPLQGQDTDLHERHPQRLRSLSEVRANSASHARGGYQPRTARRSCSGIASMAMPRIGAPRPFETSAMILGLSKWVVAWTIAFAIRAGSSLLKIPDPTNTPSEPELHDERRVGRGRDPAGDEVDDRQPAVGRDLLDELVRRLELLRRDEQLVLAHPLELADLAEDVAQLADGLDDVAGPGLALRPDHRRALVDPAERLAEVPAAAHERDLEGVLVDVVRLVGRGQDLGLVDVVDAERLEDLGLDEVADPGLRHDRDRDRVHDPLDHRRVAHPGDAAGGADVGGNALEGHDGDGAGVLGDLGLLGGDDVHDDAALEHLGEPLLGRPGRRFDGHLRCGSGVLRARSARRAGPGVLARSSRSEPPRATRIIAWSPAIARAGARSAVRPRTEARRGRLPGDRPDDPRHQLRRPSGAPGDRRLSASTSSRTSSSGSPPSRWTSRRIVSSEISPSSRIPRSSSRGSSFGINPTARSNSRTNPANAVSQSRRRSSSTSSGWSFAAAAGLGGGLLDDADDRVALADLALGDDAREPLPVVADRDVGRAGGPAPPDAPRLRHPLDDPPGLGVGEREAGRPMREAERLADLALRQRHAADHQVRVDAPDRRSDAPGRAHLAPRVGELEAQRLRGLQAAAPRPKHAT